MKNLNRYKGTGGLRWMAGVAALLLAACQSSFGQTDTNVIAIGEWSAPVTITNGLWPLRGRLLVYDAEKGNENGWPHGRIYLELQNVQPVGGPPLEFYFDSGKTCLHFDLRDGHDQPAALEQGIYNGPVPDPFMITLPPEGTIRLRVDFESQSASKPDGLQLFISPTQYWTIRPGSATDYYLSAIFSPPKKQPSSPKNYVWQGTLKLPPVKIPVRKK